jgi:hypothetical protein
MNRILCLPALALLWAVALVAREPAEDELRLFLSLDQREYFLGEPFTATARLVNQTQRSLRIGRQAFDFTAGLGLFYRLPGAAWEGWAATPLIGDGIFHTLVPPKGAEISHPFAGGPLSQAGTVEIKVRYGPRESNVVKVKVRPVEAGEEEAAALWLDLEAQSAVQFASLGLSEEPGLPKLQALVDRFPASRYAKWAKETLATNAAARQKFLERTR